MWQALGAALLIAALHLASGHLRLEERIPRSKFLSGAGGAAVAYAVLHLLPELARAQQALEARIDGVAYAAALGGIIAFYGLELWTAHNGKRHVPRGRFWVHVGALTLYNALIGHLLPSREDLWVFAVALGLHMVVADSYIREAHPDLYRTRGRWTIVAGLAVGVAVGIWAPVPERVLHLSAAFLVGSVLLNIMKEELPPERKSSFASFLVGTVAMAALLLLV